MGIKCIRTSEKTGWQLTMKNERPDQKPSTTIPSNRKHFLSRLVLQPYDTLSISKSIWPLFFLYADHCVPVLSIISTCVIKKSLKLPSGKICPNNLCQVVQRKRRRLLLMSESCTLGSNRAFVSNFMEYCLWALEKFFHALE